jgi:GAF domain-containing protein
VTQRHQSSDLDETLQRLADARSIDDITRLLRWHARPLIGSDGIALILRDGDLCHYVEEDAIGPLWKGKKFPMAACISGWSMLKRQTVRIADIAIDRRIPQDLYAGTFVRSLVMTPAELEPPVGALGAYWARVYMASPEEVATVEALARAAGEAIKRVRQNASVD